MMRARLPHRIAFSHFLLALLLFGLPGARALADSRRGELDGTWVQMRSQTEAPTARYFHLYALNPNSSDLIVSSGQTERGPTTDLWTAKVRPGPAHWRQFLLESSDPGELFFLSPWAFDPIESRFVLCTWPTDTTTRLLFLSVGHASSFSSITFAGVGPGYRSQPVFCFDQATGDFILFGGSQAGNLPNDVWRLSLGSNPHWSHIPSSTPAPVGRWGAAAIVDPTRNQLVIHGGQNPHVVPPPYLLRDAWAMDLSGTAGWTHLADTPHPIHAHTAAYDRLRDRMITFGGISPTYLSETWELPFRNTVEWRQLHVGGTLPTPVAYPGLVLDEVRDRLILFGGNHGGQPVGELWRFDFATQAHREHKAGLAHSYGAAGRMVTDAGATLEVFADRGTIRFTLPAAAPVSLTLYDLQGRRVDRPLDHQPHSAGTHEVPSNRRLPAGVYLYRLEAGGQSTTGKFVAHD